MKDKKHKFFLFMIGSWLVAKLLWTLEASRLAFHRMTVNKKIDHVVYASTVPPVSEWSYEDDRLAIVNYDMDQGTFVVYRLSRLSRN